MYKMCEIARDSLVAEVGQQSTNRRIISRHRIVASHENEPVVLVDVPLVVLGQLDVILDSLVRRDPADEQEVDQLVVECVVKRWSGRGIPETTEIDSER